MKTASSLFARLAAAGALLFTACLANPVPGMYQREISAQGYTPYREPVGDPKNVFDWNKFGPGAVLRAKEQTHYYPAKILIGDQGVADAMDPKKASPISFFTGKRVSGYDFDGHGGWTLQAVNEIAGSLQDKSDTTVDIQFGKTWLANALPESAFDDALAKAGDNFNATARTALKRGQFIVVQNAVWTESIRYYFYQTKQGGVSASYKFSDQEIAALQAKGYRVVDGGVEVNEPRFIAFGPVLDAGRQLGTGH